MPHHPDQATTVRIRLIEPDETDAVAAVTETAYSHDYELPESYRRSLLDVATRAARDQVWVAEDPATGRILGTVWTPLPGGRISPLARDGELDFRLLAVAPHARGRGIGAALTRHVLTLGRQRGARRVVMNSGSEMVGAHRLYLALGFVRLTDREGPVEVAPGRFLDLFAFGYDLD